MLFAASQLPFEWFRAVVKERKRPKKKSVKKREAREAIDPTRCNRGQDIGALVLGPVWKFVGKGRLGR